MYKGTWRHRELYIRGDIVYLTHYLCYAVCCHQHVSTLNNCPNPNEHKREWFILNEHHAEVESEDEPICPPAPRLPKLIEPEVEADDDTDAEDEVGGNGVGIVIKITDADAEGDDTDAEDEVGGEVGGGAGARDTKSENDTMNAVARKRKVDESDDVYLEKQLELYLGSDGEIDINSTTFGIKRKIRRMERNLVQFKRRKTQHEATDLRERILLLDVDIETKAFLMDKFETTRTMFGSDHSKGMQWLKTVCSLPFGKYRDLPVSLSDPPEKIKDFFNNVKSTLDKYIYGLEDVKQEILEYVARKISNPTSRGHVLALCGAAGVGKCFALNTPILTFDGRVCTVQDVKVGDLLMGDDSTPRRVLALGRGRDMMYKITHGRTGENYTVNSEHILCLRDKRTGEIHQMKVIDYLRMGEDEKTKLVGYSTGVSFAERDFEIDPYLFGEILRDETDIVIPDEYKYNSYWNRLKFLSGLTGVNITPFLNQIYKISLGYHKPAWTDDLIFVIRSLGFTASKIGDDMLLFNTDPACLLSPITVEPVGAGDYYGFMIDGNERFVLGNFIVTHNTKIIKSLAEALDFPFYQINCGGLNDVAMLTGHSETYIGSKPGKLVEMLGGAGCMNPIIYLDEIDKISESKFAEINGVFTHLLDEEQNSQFQDNYLSNVPIDLSRVFFVMAFNDPDRVDDIVYDRMKVIFIDSPTTEEKIKICEEKLMPEIIKNINFNESVVVQMDKETIEYIISRCCENETGIRQLKKTMEKVLNRLNYDILIEDLSGLSLETMGDEKTAYIITRKYVDSIIKREEKDESYMWMYN
jgi:DNA polymerase III delta prime subunit